MCAHMLVSTRSNVCLYVSLCMFVSPVYTVNSRYSATIHSHKIWQTNNFSGLTPYSLVLVYYIGTWKLWQIRTFGR